MIGIKLSRLLDALSRFKDGRRKILDMACGVGKLTCHIRNFNQDDEVFGIDISRTALAVAGSVNKGISGIYFIEGDVTRMPIASHSIDFIAGLDILEHIDNLDDAFREIKRVLRPGGLAHFHIPCEGQPFTIWWLLQLFNSVGRIKELNAGHIQRFTHKSIIGKFINEGFVVKEIHYSGHFFGQLLDFVQWSAISFRRKHLNNQLPDGGHAPEGNQKVLIGALFKTYRLFIRNLEVISFYESRILGKAGTPMCLDITAIKS